MSGKLQIRLATPRPKSMSGKGQVPINPFSGNTVIMKRASAGPLTEYLFEAELDKLGSTDPFVLALRYIYEDSALTEQEKQAGLAAVTALAGRGLAGAGKLFNSSRLSIAGGRTSRAASKMYQKKAIRTGNYATYNAKAQTARTAAKDAGRQAGKIIGGKPIKGAPAAAQGGMKTSTKLKLGLAAGVGLGGYGAYKGIQSANNFGERQNQRQASLGYNSGVR